MEKITDQRDGSREDKGPRVDKSKKRRAIAAEDSEEEGEPSAKKTKFGKSDKGGNWDKSARDGGDKEKRGKAKRDGKGGEKGERRDKGERGERGDRGDRGDRGAKSQTPAEPPVAEKRGLEKLGPQLGSMIGRKRKMRKGGK